MKNAETEAEISAFMSLILCFEWWQLSDIPTRAEKLKRTCKILRRKPDTSMELKLLCNRLITENEPKKLLAYVEVIRRRVTGDY